MTAKKFKNQQSLGSFLKHKQDSQLERPNTIAIKQSQAIAFARSNRINSERIEFAWPILNQFDNLQRRPVD